MTYVLQASRMMKAKDVRKNCEAARQNPVLLLAVELEYRKRLLKPKNRREGYEINWNCKKSR